MQDPPCNRFFDSGDRGVQWFSIRCTERLLAAGIDCSGGSIGESYENAPAETPGALFRTEVAVTVLGATCDMWNSQPSNGEEDLPVHGI